MTHLYMHQSSIHGWDRLALVDLAHVWKMMGKTVSGSTSASLYLHSNHHQNVYYLPVSGKIL